MYHEKVCNLTKTRIHVIKWQNEEFYVPTTIKCDLCNGEPTCAKFCAPGALQFIEANSINLGKQKDMVKKYSNLINEYRKIRRIKVS
jgi:Fe-S-cluster-containing hydrogenase component 2